MFLNVDVHSKSAVAAEDSDGRVVTYGELVENISLFSEQMESGTVVFCLCKNTVGSLQGYIAFVELGIVPLLLNENIDRELLDNLMEIYKPAYLWVSEKQYEQFEGELLLSLLGYHLIKTTNDKYPLHDKLQLLLATSGSTGSPKLVRYKKGNLEENAKNVADAFSWTKEERPICDLGMQYTMGLNVINTHLYVGATVLLTDLNLMSGEFWEFIKSKKATNFTGVPFSYDILHKLHFSRMELPCLTTLAQGGGKLTDTMFQEWAQYAKDAGKRFIATFGTTETAARMSFLPPEDALTKIGSIGKAIPSGEMFLVDETGQVLTQQEAEGELCYTGPNVTMGYAICQEDLQKDDEWNGTYHTGDLARRDSEGYYYITGRISRFLKLLSYRISLDQTERLITEKFHVDCACTGTDEKMKIFITDDKYKKEIMDYICKTTGLYKALFEIVLIHSIPRNDRGKIEYKRLNDMDV